MRGRGDCGDRRRDHADSNGRQGRETGIMDTEATRGGAMETAMGGGAVKPELWTPRRQEAGQCRRRETGPWTLNN